MRASCAFMVLISLVCGPSCSDKENGTTAPDAGANRNRTTPNAKLYFRTYQIGDLRDIIDLDEGFRVFLSANGIDLEPGETIADSAPSNTIVLRLSFAKHDKVSALLDRIRADHGLEGNEGKKVGKARAK